MSSSDFYYRLQNSCATQKRKKMKQNKHMTCMTNMTLLQGWCILEAALFFNKRLNILFWNSFISQTKKSRSFLLLHCDKQHLKCINFATISCASTWQMHRLCNNVMCIDMTKFACFCFFFSRVAHEFCNL